MKSGEDGSGLSFTNIIIRLLASQVDPAPHSRCVESFTLVYNHAGQEHSWRSVICFDQKSYNTIMEVSPLSARKQILANTRS
jgi:hypothetical protein